MRRTARVLAPALLTLGSALASAAQAQYTVYGVTSGASGAQQLVSFNTSSPGTVTTLGVTGANLVGVDFRPATGALYGFNGTQLFTLNLGTGAATLATGVGTPTGSTVGFNFNPTVDRIRIVDAASGTNLRVNPDNGAVSTDLAYSYASGDVNSGTPAFSGVSYTNSVAGATTTTLYGIDASRGSLVRIANPNGGTVNTVGSLGLGSGFTLAGFDIVNVGTTNTGFLAVLGAASAATSFYTVDLTSGATTFLGNVDGATRLQAFAIAPVASTVPEPGTLGLLAGGLALGGGLLRRRRARA